MDSRYIEDQVREDLPSKIVLISGPRQSGKTTFSKSLTKSFTYINYDDIDHRKIIIEKSWNRENELVIFDEIHKMKEWKRFLKGIFDVEGIPPQLIVTGSAKLETFRKVGDSLAGRFFRHRLYPFDLKELCKKDPYLKCDDALNCLMRVSGFPEPYLKGSETFYQRWRKSHLDVILRQDLVDLTAVRHLSDLETLIEMLRHRIGSPVSYSSLAQDLQVSPATVQNWLKILENLYLIFKVTPYHRNISRSIVKEPKYYFYDAAFVKGDEGTKLENIVACSLLKELHFLEDTKGIDIGLHYLRNRNGKEVDFCVHLNNENFFLIEVKTSDENFSPNLDYFSPFFKHLKQIHLVRNLRQPKTWPNGAAAYHLATWLSKMPLGRMVNNQAL